MTTRRDAVKRITGISLASWVTPVVQSVSLPAHAQASPALPSIVDVLLEISKLTIGGPSVPYAATLLNPGTGDLSVVVLQAFIQQPGASRAAGGFQVTCGAAIGVLPPGTCNTNFTLNASNTGAGSGTLIAGSATAVFELRLNGGVVDTFSIPVTLV